MAWKGWRFTNKFIFHKSSTLFLQNSTWFCPSSAFPQPPWGWVWAVVWTKGALEQSWCGGSELISQPGSAGTFSMGHWLLVIGNCCAVHLWSCSTLNLFSALLTWNLNVIVALNCSLGLCLENNEFTGELILKVQAGHKPYLLRSGIVDTGTVSSLNPGKKAPGSKPDFVDIFNYVLLVKQ